MSSWYRKNISDKSKSPQRGNRTLPSDADPALLAYAQDKATVQPGQDGSLPAMDKFGYGAQSLVYGGPIETGAGSGVGKSGKTHGWGTAGREGYGGEGRCEMRDPSYVKPKRPDGGDAAAGDHEEDHEPMLTGEERATGVDRRETSRMERLKGTFRVGGK